MGFGLCQCVLSIIICSALFLTSGAEDDITSCCKTEDGCCGPDWGLHCCNFVARICCYGEERVHALHHHHNHRHWHWNRHWFQIVLYIMLLILLTTGLLLCCKGRRREGRAIGEYTVLPGYDYATAQSLYPTAPVQQNFPSDEYPLIDYHSGQPQGHSLNSNQMVPPPPYYDAA